jgi:GNAT superfamily N-acetyltransferase
MTEQTLEIRPYRQPEYAALLRLWQAAGLDHRPRGRDSEQGLAAVSAAQPELFLVAVADGRLVGSIMGSHDGRKGWINRLAVDPAWRRRGVARQLVERLEGWFGRHGIGVIAALVDGDDAPSHPLFQALGYKRHPAISYYTKRESSDT